MSQFPASADEFYALRDDRTNACSTRRDYQIVRCALVVSEEAASTTAGRAMVRAAAKLLSRWCRHVSIALPGRSAESALGDHILAEMRDADPFGDFVVVQSGPVDADLMLVVGRHQEAAANEATVFISASGWLAGISREGPVGLPAADDENCLGAIAAACLGVGQLFKMAARMPPSDLLRDGVFDLFRLDWSDEAQQAGWPTRREIGRILMVGAGSVASCAAYGMRVAGLEGAIAIVDKDTVKVENFNRSPLFGRSNFGLAKADAIAGYLVGSVLSPSSIPMWWDEFLAQRRRSTLEYDVWLPLANEFGVRASMQHNVPPLMIHASTTANWGVNHGRHVPGRDDCLLDRFPAEVAAKNLICSTATLEHAGNGTDAALPFASMFAGVLIAADLVRALLPDYPQVPNFALFDWYGPLQHIQRWDRTPSHGCICREQGRALHERFNKTTKYWSMCAFS